MDDHEIIALYFKRLESAITETAKKYDRNKISRDTRLFQSKCRNNAEVTYI